MDNATERMHEMSTPELRELLRSSEVVDATYRAGMEILFFREGA